MHSVNNRQTLRGRETVYIFLIFSFSHIEVRLPCVENEGEFWFNNRSHAINRFELKSETVAKSTKIHPVTFLIKGSCIRKQNLSKSYLHSSLLVVRYTSLNRHYRSNTFNKPSRHHTLVLTDTFSVHPN